VTKIVTYLRTLYDVPDQNIIGHSDVGSYGGRKQDPGPKFFWNYLA